LSNIPYEKETKEFTLKSIAGQKHQLMTEALKYGLHLKAMDLDIKTFS